MLNKDVKKIISIKHTKNDIKIKYNRKELYFE